MLARLKKWIEGSRKKKREKWEAEQANLSEEDKRVVGEYRPNSPPPDLSTKGFDETTRR
jgi:hypothetical protein